MLHLFFICALCIRKLGLAATTLADLDTAIKKQQWNEAAEGNMVLRQFLRGHDYFLFVFRLLLRQSEKHHAVSQCG